MDAVSNYFEEALYASPVAYHPSKRICLRLQSCKAQTAPWNGIGVCDKRLIYSHDQRPCASDFFKYVPIVDSNKRFWGYINMN